MPSSVTCTHTHTCALLMELLLLSMLLQPLDTLELPPHSFEDAVSVKGVGHGIHELLVHQPGLCTGATVQPLIAVHLRSWTHCNSSICHDMALETMLQGKLHGPSSSPSSEKELAKAIQMVSQAKIKKPMHNSYARMGSGSHTDRKAPTQFLCTHGIWQSRRQEGPYTIPMHAWYLAVTQTGRPLLGASWLQSANSVGPDREAAHSSILAALDCYTPWQVTCRSKW